jgi:ABC-type transport system substrate-binding protein
MEITLIANENYYGTAPLVDKILFKKIELKETALAELAAGNVDIIDGQYIVSPAEIEGSAYADVFQDIVSDPSTQEVSFNHLNEYINGTSTPNGLADPTNSLEFGKYVRKAISHLVKRDYIVSEVMHGLASPGNTLMPNVAPGWLGYGDLPYRNYSVETAINYMEMAGFDYTTDVDLTAEITASNSLFSLYMLSPNTNEARNTWSILLESELAEIGIFVAQHLSTSWSVIIPLTFGSDVPSPPGATNATDNLVGWDIFFVGYSWDLDYNPISMFDSPSLRPLGDNFYNFPGDVALLDGVSWDDLLTDYLTEVDDVARVDKVELLQEFMYEWEPVATIIYPQTVWVYLDSVTGIDSLLISISSQAWNGVDCAREVTISDSAFGLYSVMLMFTTLFMVAVYRRKR